MDAKKRKRDEYESDTVTYLRRGTITILDALDVQLPDVFADQGPRAVRGGCGRTSTLVCAR